MVYGLLGLGIFVQWLSLGRVVLAGALTMALLSLPVIIISSQEALKAVPWSLRKQPMALEPRAGRHCVSCPTGCLPCDSDGVILAVSRQLAKPHCLSAGAAGFVSRKPDGFMTIHNDPDPALQLDGSAAVEFRELAAAGIIVLLALLIMMNSVAIILRQRSRKGALVTHGCEPHGAQNRRRAIAIDIDQAAAPSVPVIQVRDLNVYYGAFHAVGDVTFDVPQNRITALIGPSDAARARCYVASTG